MNMLLTLLTLIAIFLNDHKLGKAFDSQCNNEDIFRKDLRGMQSVKEMLSSDQENFYTYPLKSETNTRSNFERFSVSVRNDVSSFMQISVPNDILSITTSNFKQLNVPTIATLIDLRTCDNSLFFYFDTITATSTAKLTYVSASTTTPTRPMESMRPLRLTRMLFPGSSVCLGFVGFVSIGLISLGGITRHISLVGPIGFSGISGLVGQISLVSLGGFIGQISLIDLSASSNHRPIGFIRVIGSGLIALSASAVSLAHRLFGSSASLAYQLIGLFANNLPQP